MDDADAEEYAGIPAMSAESEDEAADRPVPDDSDSDSDEEMLTPQAAADDRDDAVPETMLTLMWRRTEIRDTRPRKRGWRPLMIRSARMQEEAKRSCDRYSELRL